MNKVFNSANFYSLLEWIMWLTYVNLLWIGGLITGLGVLGFFPATAAMFTVMRELLREGSSVKNIFHSFASTYKNEFIKSNAVGFTMIGIGYVLYLDFLFIQNITGPLYYVLFTGLISVSIVYLITLLYIVPVYVHYKLPFFQYFRHAVLIGIVSPFMTMLMIAGLIVLYFILSSVPGLIPFITTSSIALILMGCSLLLFRKLEQKQDAVLKKC